MPTSDEITPRGLVLDQHWEARYVIPPGQLTGANGLRFSADGQLYVAQFLSSQVSALDVDTGAERKLFGEKTGFLAPDDLAFDDHGNLIATEVMHGRVSLRSRSGELTILADNVPAANGIVFHQGRLFADEFRSGGRLLEIFSDGRSPRTILDGLAMPNALCVGADGYLYFPTVATGQVWRVHPDGHGQELVYEGLAMPTSVKADPHGGLVVTEAATGRVIRIDLGARTATLLVEMRPGLDNCAHDSSGRLFVSHFIDGGVAEILPDGSAREIVAAGLLGPWGIDVDERDVLHIADGMSLHTQGEQGALQAVTTFATHGFPGFIRNVRAIGQGSFVVSTSAGSVALLRAGQDPLLLASGLDQITDLAHAGNGTILVAEAGTGRLLKVSANNVSVVARGLGRPMGIVLDSVERCTVTDAANGRVLRIECNRGVETLTAGLLEPHGIVSYRDFYYLIDRGAKTLLRMSNEGADVAIVASHLATGGGSSQKVLPGSEALPGPLFGISALAVRSDGTLYISCDSEGSVVALHRT